MYPTTTIWLCVGVCARVCELVGANPTPHIYAGTMGIIRQDKLERNARGHLYGQCEDIRKRQAGAQQVQRSQ